MKAWKVSQSNDEWIALIHADTAGKAKLTAMEEYNLDNFTDMRAKRFPGMDNKKFTYQDCKDAGFQYTTDYSEDSDGTGYLAPEYFTIDCPCNICNNDRD